MVTSLRGTPGPVPCEYSPKIVWRIAFPVPEIAPDPVKVISCHKEAVGIFEQGNMSHPFPD
jgi:hypothetical protein